MTTDFILWLRMVRNDNTCFSFETYCYTFQYLETN